MFPKEKGIMSDDIIIRSLFLYVVSVRTKVGDKGVCGVQGPLPFAPGVGGKSFSSKIESDPS